MPYQITQRDVERTDSMSRWFCSTKCIPSREIEDYISIGHIALVDAVQRFKPNKGVKFFIYAQYRIRGDLADQARNQFWYRATKQPKPQPISLEQLLETGWEPSADGLEGRTINKDLCQKLLATLKDRERNILTLYFFRGHRMKEIAPIFGLTESRVSQIIDKALDFLKSRSLSLEFT